MTSVSGRSSGSQPDPGFPATGSIVSGERIIRALYGVANLRQARALSDEDVRCALAIADALGELAAEKVSGPFRKGVYASADLALDRSTAAMLATRSGATPRQVDRGLELLLASQVLLRVPGRAEVRIARECLVDIRTSLPGAPLAHIRDALLARRAALMPALGVLRHLRDLAPDASGWIVTSLEQAAERTFFKRSTVARALVDLESVAAIERARGPGLRSHYRMMTQGAATSPVDRETDSAEYDGLGTLLGRPSPRDVVSGFSPAADRDDAWRAQHDGTEVAPRTPVEGLRLAERTGHAPSGDVCLEQPGTGRTGDPDSHQATIEISGVAFPIPQGVTLSPEIDPDGRLWYRLGSARIGPICL